MKKTSASGNSAARFFTIPEVAEILELSTRSVRQWIKKKKLVAHYLASAGPFGSQKSICAPSLLGTGASSAVSNQVLVSHAMTTRFGKVGKTLIKHMTHLPKCSKPELPLQSPAVLPRPREARPELPERMTK